MSRLGSDIHEYKSFGCRNYRTNKTIFHILFTFVCEHTYLQSHWWGFSILQICSLTHCARCAICSAPPALLPPSLRWDDGSIIGAAPLSSSPPPSLSSLSLSSSHNRRSCLMCFLTNRISREKTIKAPRFNSNR